MLSVGGGQSIKYVALVLLVLQNTCLITTTRYSRSVLHDTYLSSTVVVMMELCKLLSCVFIMVRENGWKNTDLLGLIKTSLVMSVPGLAYVIQNSLQLLALNHLEASVFSILSQLKVLTTALFAVMVLGQKQSARKWRALLLLVVGAILVQYEPDQAQSNKNHGGRNQFVGLMSTIGMVCLSGFAGIYLEKYLKNADLTIWQRNFQLAFWGVIFALFGAFMDYEKIISHGFFTGYSFATLAVIFFAAFGGLIVAVVVKYCNTIIKGFATSVSIILTTILSIFLFDAPLTLLFVLGSICVLLSIFNYNEDSGPAGPPAKEHLPLNPLPSRIS